MPWPLLVIVLATSLHLNPVTAHLGSGVLLAYLGALGLTLALEIPVVAWVLRRSPWQRILPAVVVANLLSHPALHFALPLILPPHPKGPFVLVGELLVFAFEAALFAAWVRPRPWPLALAASAAANLASFAAGLLVLPRGP